FGAAMINIPIADNVAAGRAVISRRHTGGWINDVVRGNDNINDTDVTTIRANLLLTPTDQWKIKLNYYHVKLDADWSNLVNNKDTNIKSDTVVGGPDGFYGTSEDRGSAYISYDFGLATIENTLSYGKQNIPAKYVI